MNANKQSKLSNWLSKLSNGQQQQQQQLEQNVVPVSDSNSENILDNDLLNLRATTNQVSKTDLDLGLLDRPLDIDFLMKLSVPQPRSGDLGFGVSTFPKTKIAPSKSHGTLIDGGFRIPCPKIKCFASLALYFITKLLMKIKNVSPKNFVLLVVRIGTMD